MRRILLAGAVMAGVLVGGTGVASAGPSLGTSALEALTPFAGVPGNVSAPVLTPNGLPDLVVPDFGTDQISVRLNQGHGHFGPVRRYQVGLQPSFIATGDFNGDGSTDIAVSNAASGNVSVLLNRGNGTLAPAVNYSVSAPGSVSTGSFSIAAADLTHNGILDLVTTNSVTNDVSVLMGRGNGTFGAARSFPIAGSHSVGVLPFALSLADLNGDGNLDLVAGGATGTTVMLGDGAGGFHAVSSNLVGIDIACTQVGDLNEDGHPDIVATGTGTLNAQVLIGDGTGNFTAGPNLWSGGIGPQCFSMDDFNHDGHLDLAIVNSSSLTGRGVVRVLFGNGHGGFSSTAVTNTYPVQFAPWATAVGDFNGTGETGLAVANSFPASVTVLDSRGDGHFTDAGTFGM